MISEEGPAQQTGLPEEQPTPDSPPAQNAPVTADARIHSLDILRGFSLMGVLLMNMQAFAMPFCAYMNPSSYAFFSGLDRWSWHLNHVLADGKFITIFSMMFGAGIVLMTRRAEERTGRSAGLHYRRMFFMALFGVAHALLLWFGDILFTYALCGTIVWLFRRVRIWILVVVSALLIAIPALLSVGFAGAMSEMPSEDFQEIMAFWQPSAEQSAAVEEAYRGGFVAQTQQRFSEWVGFLGFLPMFVGRILGVMLLGMILFRTGVFSAARSDRFYIVLAFLGLSTGLSLAALSAVHHEMVDWEMAPCFGAGSLFNYFGSLLAALGWIGLVMLACRRNWFRGLLQRLGAVGRMAFTNYLMHSVICTTIFYGHGLGLFGTVDRVSQTGLVVAIGLLQLWYSPLWLSRFRFGPMEWLWRFLTYLGRPAR